MGKGTKQSSQNPKKNWLANQIRAEIDSDRYRPGDTFDSERKLCERFGVSRVTVRAAMDLLEGEGVIQRNPRQRVTVKQRRSGSNQQVRLPDEHGGQVTFLRLGSNPWTSDISLGITTYCDQNRQPCRILDLHESHEALLKQLATLPEDTTGVILVAYDNREYRAVISELIERGTKVVLLERQIEGLALSCVSVDNFTGGYLATSHLLQEHKRPVFHIGHRGSSSVTRKRMQGWFSAMSEYDISDIDEFFFEIGVSDETLAVDFGSQKKAGYEAAMRILREKPRQENGWSIFAAKDFIAAGVYLAAEELGLTVGGDIAVVGFGDGPMAGKASPALSSIHRPRTELGYAAGRLLCQLIASKQNAAIHEVMPVRLIVRESSTGIGR